MHSVITEDVTGHTGHIKEQIREEKKILYKQCNTEENQVK